MNNLSIYGCNPFSTYDRCKEMLIFYFDEHTESNFMFTKNECSVLKKKMV